jgi:hypothetical protein
MDIDIAALGEIVDTLLWCHIKSERMDELPAVLERLRGNIDDERWRRRIIYVQAMHALWPDWNESAGRQELRKLGTLGTDDDVEILQLYLDLFEDSLGFSMRAKASQTSFITRARKPSSISPSAISKRQTPSLSKP